MNIEIALRMALVYFIVDHWSQSDCNVLPVKVRLQKLRGVTSDFGCALRNINREYPDL